ncbi:MAG: hypothetical protein ACI9RM_002022 [Ulvibacter sp.]|jgi:hypothetical protein
MKNLLTSIFVFFFTITSSYGQTYIRLSAGPDKMYQSYTDHLANSPSGEHFTNSSHSGYTAVLGLTQQLNSRLALEFEADYFKRERRIRNHLIADIRYNQKFSRLSFLFRFMPLKYFYLSLGPSINFRFDSKVISANHWTLEDDVYDYPPEDVTTFGGNIGIGCAYKNFFINLNYLSEIPAQKWVRQDPPYADGIFYKRISSLRLTFGYSLKILKKGAIKIKRRRTVRGLG